MSLDADTPLAAAAPRAWITRHYQGHWTTLHVAGSAPLRLTHNHPVLTHAGWAPARNLIVGMHVVALDGDAVTDAVRVGMQAAAAQRHGVQAVPTSRRDFWGDAGPDVPRASPADVELGPMVVGEEGETPALDPWPLLAALTSPQAFGAATWAAACAKVPGLAATWPSGTPTAQADVLDAAARARLGAAVDVLPAPPVDHGDWATATTGIPGALRLARVTRVEPVVGGGQVCDVVSERGCVVAGGIVVA